MAGEWVDRSKDVDAGWATLQRKKFALVGSEKLPTAGHVLEGYTYEDIIDDPKYFKDLLLKHKLLCFRELNLTGNQNPEVLGALGYHVFGHHKEDHRNTIEMKYRVNDPSELLVPWHVENLHQQYPPEVAGWNMEVFTCPKNHGRTGFVNLAECTSRLPIETVNYLRDFEFIVVRQAEDGDEAIKQVESGSREVSIKNKRRLGPDGRLMHGDANDYYDAHVRKAIEDHPLTNEPVLRYELDWIYLDNFPRGPKEIDNWHRSQRGQTATGTCFTYCSKEDRLEIDLLGQEIYLNPDNQFWWEWTQGDFLLADLFVMAHTVTGGFQPEERRLDVTFNTTEFHERQAIDEKLKICPSDSGEGEWIRHIPEFSEFSGIPRGSPGS